MRDEAEEGHRVGTLYDAIGPVPTVPQIVFYDEGEATFYQIDNNRPYNGRDSESIL